MANSTAAHDLTDDEQGLLCVAKAGELERVDDYLLKGTNPNFNDEYGDTPLAVASANGHEAVVSLLLAKGAKANNTLDLGWTPLHAACGNGSVAIVRLLLEREANVNAKNCKHETPLHRASMNGHETIVALLLEKGAWVDARNYEGSTPLIVACRRGHPAIMRLLLEHGADIDTVGGDEKTLLHCECNHGNLAMVTLLLEYGAGVNISSTCNEDGWTPLHWAIKSRRCCETIVTLLLEHGADVNARDGENCTPLHFASTIGNVALVTKLLEKGAEVNATTKSGRTPLDLTRCVPVAMLLSKHGGKNYKMMERNPSEEAEYVKELYSALLAATSSSKVVIKEDKLPAMIHDQRRPIQQGKKSSSCFVMTPNDSDVCFLKQAHPGTKKWRAVIQLFSLHHEKFPEWHGTLCDQIERCLRQEYGIKRFLVCRGKYGKPRMPTKIGSNKWYGITKREMFNVTKRRFLDDRKYQQLHLPKDAYNEKELSQSMPSQPGKKRKTISKGTFDQKQPMPGRANRELQSAVNNELCEEKQPLSGHQASKKRKSLSTESCDNNQRSPGQSSKNAAATERSHATAAQLATIVMALQAKCHEAIQLHQSENVAVWAMNAAKVTMLLHDMEKDIAGMYQRMSVGENSK